MVNILLQLFMLTCVIGVSSSTLRDKFAYHRLLLNNGLTSNGGFPAELRSKIRLLFSMFRDMTDKFDTFTWEVLEDPEKFLSVAHTDFNVTESCMIGMLHFLEGLRHEKLWAINMLDSTGKLPSGILQGDFIWPGEFDQCLNISAEMKGFIQNTTVIKGKYFRVSATLPITTPQDLMTDDTLTSALKLHGLTVGICLPNACTETDVDGLANLALFFMHLLSPSTLKNATGNYTDLILDITNPSVKFSSEASTIVAIFFCCFIGVFIILGTLYDYFIHQPKINSFQSYDESHDSTNVITDISINSTDRARLFGDETNVDSVTLIHKPPKSGVISKICLSFSMYTNSSKILSTDVSPDQILAVTGIRVLSMGWVILGHTCFLVLGLTKNIIIFPDWLKRWSFQAMPGAFFAVDSFFLLSGMLVTYLTLKEMQRNDGRLNWIMFYFHRFWRLTPAYMLIILMYTGFFQYWSDGPFWIDHSPDYEQCTKYWWRNLLYVQNFFPEDEQCMSWSWYLANDMQFFIISPVILIFLYRKAVIGYILLAVLFLMQFLSRGLLSSEYKIKMSYPSFDETAEWIDNIYARPYCRISPYIIGIIVGYILWKTDRKVHIPKPGVVTGWMLSLVCVTSVVYATLGENRGHINSVTVDAVFNALSKTIWSLGVGWIIFACNTGYGGIITSFLSLPLWSPLSRLTYCAYLVHPVIIYIYVLSQRHPLYLSDINIVYMFFGHWMLTYIVAFVTSFVFEAPMIGLERALWRKSK